MRPLDGFLGEMERTSRARVQALAPDARRELARRAREGAPPRPLRLDPRGFDLVAEIKRRSPALGELAAEDEPALAARARAYATGGAAALSILTEPTRFDGDLAHLELARAAVELPLMRKDFLVDPVQVLEARAHGADGVLLVTRMLDDTRLGELLACAREHALFVLLEAFDEHDLARVPARTEEDVLLVGVNTRDLATLAVRAERTLALAPKLPRGFAAVAESGIEGPTDVRTAVRAGYALALVGTALMRAPEPARAVAELVAAGREERTRCASS